MFDQRVKLGTNMSLIQPGSNHKFIGLKILLFLYLIPFFFGLGWGGLSDLHLIIFPCLLPITQQSQISNTSQIQQLRVFTAPLPWQPMIFQDFSCSSIVYLCSKPTSLSPQNSVHFDPIRPRARVGVPLGPIMVFVTQKAAK